MTTLTLEDINDAALSAAMCDDYTQHKKEMAEVARMRAEFNAANDPQQPRPATPAAVRQVPEGHVRCGSFEEAKTALNALCGV